MFVQCVFQDGTRVNIEITDMTRIFDLERRLNPGGQNMYRYFHRGKELARNAIIPETAIDSDEFISVADNELCRKRVALTTSAYSDGTLFRRFRAPEVESNNPVMHDIRANPFETDQSFLTGEYLALDNVHHDPDDMHMTFGHRHGGLYSDGFSTSDYSDSIDDPIPGELDPVTLQNLIVQGLRGTDLGGFRAWNRYNDWVWPDHDWD